MYTNQQILDHAQDYLYNRITNYNGKLVRGWGSPDNLNDRCIVGTLDRSTYSRTDCAWFCNLWHKLEINGLYNICSLLMAFNDSHARTPASLSESGITGAITKLEVDRFLMALARDLNLKYTIKDLKFESKVSGESDREEEIEEELL